MATVWIVPAGSDTAPDAGNGDFLLRRSGNRVEVGSVDGACTWLGTVDPGLMPELPDVDGPTRAPDQERALIAVQGVATAQDNRGG